MANNHFYSRLELHQSGISELLGDETLFSSVPEDWHVVITDIKGSTQAVMDNRHEQVNFIATGSIVTVLNIAFSMNVTIPFFFGGDGATFIIPDSMIDRIMKALTVYKNNTLENFNLELRASSVPVQKLHTDGHQIRIARFSSSANFAIPIVLGNGLNYAEQLIKGDHYIFNHPDVGKEDLDLNGMQCRWDKIPPPEDKEEIVTLLIIAREVSQQAEIFKRILNKIDELYGDPEKRQPISIAKLRLKTTFNRLGMEMRLRIGRIKIIELIQHWIFTGFIYFYFKTRNGKKYLKSLVEMSDTLVMDGKINTVISGTRKQRESLQELLDHMEANNEIVYGMHLSNASIMSCYVRDVKDDHIHFVDGSDGGYTQAARMLKEKLGKSERPKA
ncbi:DUF3095 domain-containing protein [Flavobacterium pallidum]|uniref:DUF3095 domain-containing protein n=1 Tax=Flavobacterium pallidum TaxID=2172098 RepID=A0A2S1SGU6_9FLAO|nr:DUF3095 domain-containing protein [Flavobacterium pallidum]AWI25567.1 DUF3095 domain-containing protein [Flavobacterium pallidum]